MRAFRRVMAVTLLASSLAFAQAVPSQVSFTGRVVDSGAPVNGPRDFIFKLFPTSVGGTEVWTETRNAITVTDGAVNVALGESTPLTDTIFDGQTLYLEVSIGGTLLTPRTPVMSVPYALRAGVSGQVGTLTAAQIQRRVASGCVVGTAIQSINADGTVVCQAVGANDAGVSTITNIIAGAGLTGGGAIGNVTVAADFGGTGTAGTVSRSDHNHTGTYLPLGPVLACGTTDKVVGIAASGSVICGGDVNTTYSVLTSGGLSLSGSNQFSLLTSCAPNQVLVAGAGGVWACGSPGGVTSVGGTPPLASSGGATPSLSLATCPTAGHIYKMVAGSWACSPDLDVPYTASLPLNVTGNVISMPVCANPGEILKVNAGSWRCMPDDDSGGTVTAVNVSGALTSTGGTAPTIGIGILPVANGGAGASLAATGGARQFVKQSAAGSFLSVGTITAAELPAHVHAGADVVSGTVGVAFGGTGATLTATGGPGQFVKQTTAGGAMTVEAIATSELPSGTQVWAAPPSCPSGQLLRGLNNAGGPICVGPAPTDAIFNITANGAGGTYAAVYIYCNNASCNIAVPGTGFYAAGSSAGTVTVTRTGVGAYTVNIPWMGATSVPQITIYGGSPGTFCKSGPSFTGPNFTVQCFNLFP